eukprot:183806-Alexandrium_andersonii.AAC.1
MGDFNARVQERANDLEDMVGANTFHRESARVGGQTAEVADSREKFLSFVAGVGAIVVNTFFPKQD